jgi:2-polyprenyl-3-methyl-5-hydroxy-6-metoxy-1,4-benzoquinol methylase
MTPTLTACEALQSQISSSIRTIRRELCPLCKGQGDLLYTGLVDWLYGIPQRWGIRLCAPCRLAWLDPQPVANEIQRLYSNYCTHSVNRAMTWIGQFQHAASECALERFGYPVERSKRILPRLLSYLPSIKRTALLSVFSLPPSRAGILLDVGCGNGEFIARMQSFGWKVSGVDPDPKAISYGRSQGLDIYNGTISDLPETALYDVITLRHVIEHVADPIALLLECRKRVRPGGRLMITTPNIKSIGHAWFRKYWRGLEVPRHFLLFSTAALRECVERAALRVESMSTETRLAQMIYCQSACAAAGGQDVGNRTSHRVSTKIAARLFRGIEGLMVALRQDVGEEILCVCAPTKT